MTSSTAAAGEEQWSRRSLLRVLAGITVAALTLLGGLGYAIYSAVASTRTPPAAARETAVAQPAEQLPAGPARRDAIAAAPMLAVPPQAGRSGTPAAESSPAIMIPPAGRAGPVDVATGFPKTPEGAVGQLAAIDVAVLQGMSIERAHAVHDAWAATGAPPATSWVLTVNIQAFLGSSAGQNAEAVRGSVAVTPVAAQVKGVDGPDWVLACVLLDVKARIAAQARIAYGHCERMQWTEQDGGRWVIAPGAAPVKAPSTWPGTDLATQAGWRTWTTAPDQ